MTEYSIPPVASVPALPVSGTYPSQAMSDKTVENLVKTTIKLLPATGQQQETVYTYNSDGNLESSVVRTHYINILA
jgi:hypothetical protein